MGKTHLDYFKISSDDYSDPSEFFDAIEKVHAEFKKSYSNRVHTVIEAKFYTRFDDEKRG